MVMFDLPTYTKQNRKSYNKFRKELLKLGFVMYQYSIYILPFKHYYKKDNYIEKIKSIMPKHGKITILTITEKQFKNRVVLEQVAEQEKILEKYHQNVLDLDFFED
jgi:CRISPR-associated protein Cas2